MRTIRHYIDAPLAAGTRIVLPESALAHLVRVHRGTLVIKQRIRGLEKTHDGRHFLRLDGCEDRPQVSRRNLPAIRKLIRNLT